MEDKEQMVDGDDDALESELEGSEKPEEGGVGWFVVVPSASTL